MRQLALDNLSGNGTVCPKGFGTLSTGVLYSQESLFRDREVESGSLAEFGLHPDSAATLLDDALADC